MHTFIGLLIIAVLVYALRRWGVRPILRKLGFGKAKVDPWLADEPSAAREWLAQLGPTHDERMAVIERMFDAGDATLRSTTFTTWERKEQVFVQAQQKIVSHQARAIVTVSRNIVGMDNRERAYMRVAEELNSAAEGSVKEFRSWRTALLWGDGKGVADNWQYTGFSHTHENTHEIVGTVLKQIGMTVDTAIARLQQLAASASSQTELNPLYRPILNELNTKMLPSGGGAWLKSSELDTSPFAPRSQYALHIGTLTDGTRLTHSGEESLVTIAPPGSGKTECNVYPNLLSWNGPAVVLDVSGEIYKKTAGWRAANVGPVFKFSPLEPDNSHRFNPLALIRQQPDYIWEDSRLLAEMMIVPSLSTDPFWENEARTILTAAIAHVCFANPPDQRPMHAVLDVLFGGQAWDEMIIGLSGAIDVRVMQQHATALTNMNEKTLSSVLQTARSSLGAWTGERVARVTAASDWDPSDLRGETKPTVYISIRPNEVEAYLSLLRVFIGQHIRTLTAGDVPPHGSPPILFMLDELPRLKNMPPVDEALNIGRKYGLRLWMFSQSLGQFKESYGNNAEGMLGACAVRIYMNPTGADGLADRISEELGYTDSLHDNSRKKLVEPVDLTGPKYADLQIVLSNGGKPATVEKNWAYADPELKRRMDIEPPSIQDPRERTAPKSLESADSPAR